MAKGKLLKSLVKKAKKPSGIKKAQPRYVKTASGMKLNPERFKQKPLPKTKKLAQTKAAKKPGFKTGVAAGTALGVAASQGAGMKKAKTKESSTKQMADEAYKKQKKRQKEYRQKKGGKGNR